MYKNKQINNLKNFKIGIKWYIKQAKQLEIDFKKFYLGIFVVKTKPYYGNPGWPEIHGLPSWLIQVMDLWTFTTMPDFIYSFYFL